MVQYVREYWFSGFGPLSSILNRMHFRKYICFLSMKEHSQCWKQNYISLMKMSSTAAVQLKLTTCEVDNMGTEQNVYGKYGLQ
jgi:hypothetical protein